MKRTTAAYLGASATLLTVLALVRPTPPPPPPPPAEWPEQADVTPADPRLSVPWLRMLTRRWLASEVIDGRRSVFEAAALFRALDRTDPALGPPRTELGVPLPVDFPAATEDERYCLLVARWVYNALRDECRAVEVVARLAAEVRAEAAARGSVRLPDPATLEPVEKLLAEARAALTR